MYSTSSDFFVLVLVFVVFVFVEVDLLVDVFLGAICLKKFKCCKEYNREEYCREKDILMKMYYKKDVSRRNIRYEQIRLQKNYKK